MSTLSARNGWTLRKSDARVCTCEPENPRHVFPWHCIPMAEALAWAEANGCTPKIAREACWLARTFAIPPEEIPL